MKKTILHGKHVSLKAKLAEFGGYEMPIQYAGIIAEHSAARTAAAVFDTCHMGEFKFAGASAVNDLERLLSCDVSDIKIGTCRYGFICNEFGGVIDDMILYRMADDEFMMVVNAATVADDRDWIAERISHDTSLTILCENMGKIDLQGPAAPKIAAALFLEPIGELKFYNFMRNSYQGKEVIVSRTGYTGEIGFEFYGDNTVIENLWDDCIARGATPAGLGARDILRLEMGFPLYGHELSAERNAGQAGFDRAISTKKIFIGSEAIRAAAGQGQILRGICIDGRRTAHVGDVISDGSGNKVGMITSAAFSPMLGHAVALGYIDVSHAEYGTAVKVVGGRSELDGKICSMPFYKKGTARGDIKLYL